MYEILCKNAKKTHMFNKGWFRNISFIVDVYSVGNTCKKLF